MVAYTVKVEVYGSVDSTVEAETPSVAGQIVVVNEITSVVTDPMWSGQLVTVGAQLVIV